MPIQPSQPGSGLLMCYKNSYSTMTFWFRVVNVLQKLLFNHTVWFSIVTMCYRNSYSTTQTGSGLLQCVTETPIQPHRLVQGCYNVLQKLLFNHHILVQGCYNVLQKLLFNHHRLVQGCYCVTETPIQPSQMGSGLLQCVTETPIQPSQTGSGLLLCYRNSYSTITVWFRVVTVLQKLLFNHHRWVQGCYNVLQKLLFNHHRRVQDCYCVTETPIQPSQSGSGLLLCYINSYSTITV